jgi:ssRNA-specific RNase YbeY (16S rRNA maturation enzyme)
MLITFSVIVTAKEMQKQINTKYKGIQCPTNVITQEEAYNDITSGDPQGFMQCYCYA